MITWTLDINEANLTLAVLGKLPYEQVCDLIGKLRAQMQMQLSPPAPTEKPP